MDLVDKVSVCVCVCVINLFSHFILFACLTLKPQWFTLLINLKSASGVGETCILHKVTSCNFSK